MKKTLFVAAAMLLMMGANAQNTFKGTVKYKIESTGEVAFQIPEEQSTVEVKVFGEQAKMGNTVQNGRKVTQCVDYSMYVLGLKSQFDVELESDWGDAKFMFKNEVTQNEIDSLTIPVTEGYYFEYVAGETKTVADRTAKKAVLHVFDDEGTDHPIEFWYDPTIGPSNNFLFNGIAGMPLQFTQNAGEGRAITYTAVEVKEGKVKEADLLLPAGYKEVSTEEYKTFMTELKDAMEVAGLGGGDEE